MRYKDVLNKFPTEESAVRHYIAVEHPYGVNCYRCGSDKVYQEAKRYKVFYCNDCKSSFSLFKNTMYEKSSTDLRKWFYAIHLYISNPKYVTAARLQRELDVTYKTAWRMLRQIELYEFK